MKILVATKETQGWRKNDFCWVPEGEVVGFSSECDGERVDGKCGCRRSFAGVHCNKATTTVKVVEVPDAGFKKLDELFNGMDTEPRYELLRVAKAFPVGAILERRGDYVQQRLNP